MASKPTSTKLSLRSASDASKSLRMKKPRNYLKMSEFRLHVRSSDRIRNLVDAHNFETHDWTAEDDAELKFHIQVHRKRLPIIHTMIPTRLGLYKSMNRGPQYLTRAAHLFLCVMAAAGEHLLVFQEAIRKYGYAPAMQYTQKQAADSGMNQYVDDNSRPSLSNWSGPIVQALGGSQPGTSHAVSKNPVPRPVIPTMTNHLKEEGEFLDTEVGWIYDTSGAPGNRPQRESMRENRIPFSSFPRERSQGAVSEASHGRKRAPIGNIDPRDPKKQALAQPLSLASPSTSSADSRVKLPDLSNVVIRQKTESVESLKSVTQQIEAHTKELSALTAELVRIKSSPANRITTESLETSTREQEARIMSFCRDLISVQEVQLAVITEFEHMTKELEGLKMDRQETKQDLKEARGLIVQLCQRLEQAGILSHQSDQS